MYRDDHEPAHVHVIKDGEVIVNLTGPDGTPEIRQAFGATEHEAARAAGVCVGEVAFLR